MTLEAQAQGIIQVALAAMLAMIVGMDRERRGSPAGMRTHMLVGMGACLLTVLSIQAFGPNDTSRVAAGIVTGIGFLGAGVILKRERDIHQLTTAASIWATAALGMAAGTGAWLLAAGSTILTWVILRIFRGFEPRKRASRDTTPD